MLLTRVYITKIFYEKQVNFDRTWLRFLSLLNVNQSPVCVCVFICWIQQLLASFGFAVSNSKMANDFAQIFRERLMVQIYLISLKKKKNRKKKPLHNIFLTSTSKSNFDHVRCNKLCIQLDFLFNILHYQNHLLVSIGYKFISDIVNKRIYKC